MTAPGGEWCRGCWRTFYRDVHRLLCGDVLCSECLAPTQLLPLRCCQQPVPSATLVQALPPVELAFYQHLVAQETEKKREHLMGKAADALAAPCDFCSELVRTRTTQDADASLLSCGHVYCTDCIAMLRESVGGHDATSPICCTDIQAVTTPTQRTGPRQAVPHQPIRPEPTPVPMRAAASAFVKAKARLGTITTTYVETNGGGVDDAYCVDSFVRMRNQVNAIRAACGHFVCRTCLLQRCRRAVRGESNDVRAGAASIQCCNSPIAADTVKAALGARLLAKYQGLFAACDVVVAAPLGKRKATQAVARPSVANRKRKTAEPTQTRLAVSTKPLSNDCVASLTPVTQGRDQLRGSCGHLYCLSCVKTMALVSLEDRILVPIRCCRQEIPIDFVRRALTKRQMAQYERFLAERDWHNSDLASDHEYARVVKKVRGKQCPSCGVGVQKVFGCSTMHCPHGHVFCWTCAANPCSCGR